MASEITWPEVRPASDIASWPAWPDAVRETLKLWNRKRALTFGGAGRVFKCCRCQEFHHAPQYGTAVLLGKPFCDPCLIVFAKEFS